MYKVVRSQSGLINIDDVIDIIRESPNEQIYYENEILKVILFGRPDLSVCQYKKLVYEYGMTLRQKDLHGRRLFVRMVSLLESQRVL